ncbi:DUF6083 domain-containing protein [Streptomyces rimosus]|uniref:DUF6083 domain-containing protein n=1 Tax=Streptomyces rimosus TaxID=1927 RepID=UPI0004C631F1|nr:DUF6083 domain-containing protein [Streptomyces rimosus]
MGVNMQLHQKNQSKLLRRTAADRCAYCGTPIEWFDRYDTRRIPLTPEVPARRVPARFQWYVNRGLAYPGLDPRAGGYCRLPHPAVCPAVEHTGLPRELADVVKMLAVRMQARIDRGEFIPAPVPSSEEEISEPDPDSSDTPDSTRHIMQYSTVLRLAPGRIEDVQCTAAVDDGQRCPNMIFDVDEGSWQQVDVPYAPGREGQLLLSRTEGRMWVWALKPTDFLAVSRWLNQRCAEHDGLDVAPDFGPREWVDFHPLRHSDFVVTERPEGYDPPALPAELTVHDGPGPRQQCAASGCSNATVARVEEGWLCWKCQRAASRRARTHRRWQSGANPAS